MSTIPLHLVLFELSHFNNLLLTIFYWWEYSSLSIFEKGYRTKTGESSRADADAAGIVGIIGIGVRNMRRILIRSRTVQDALQQTPIRSSSYPMIPFLMIDVCGFLDDNVVAEQGLIEEVE